MTDNQLVSSVFSKYGLKKTTFRGDLYLLFYKTKNSLSVKKIIEKFSKTDKASIYRALESFEKSGLIHKVPDKDNLLRFSLCSSECSPKEHSHDHAHLLCNECNETFCLDDFEFPTVKKHDGFQINNYKIILEGYCAACQVK